MGRLAGVWREPVAEAITAAAGRGVVLDLRSSAYVALGPVPPALAERTAVARVLQEKGGKRTIVSHHNKATKGRIVRGLLGEPKARTVDDLAGALGDRPAHVHDVEVGDEAEPFEEDVQGFVAALEKSFRMRVKYNAKLN